MNQPIPSGGIRERFSEFLSFKVNRIIFFLILYILLFYPISIFIPPVIDDFIYKGQLVRGDLFNWVGNICAVVETLIILFLIEFLSPAKTEINHVENIPEQVQPAIILEDNKVPILKRNIHFPNISGLLSFVILLIFLAIAYLPFVFGTTILTMLVFGLFRGGNTGTPMGGGWLLLAYSIISTRLVVSFYTIIIFSSIKYRKVPFSYWSKSIKQSLVFVLLVSSIFFLMICFPSLFFG